MQKVITNLKQNENKFVHGIKEISHSKYQLIISSAEIDDLRYKIKQYTKGNWDGVVANDNSNKNGYYSFN